MLRALLLDKTMLPNHQYDSDGRDYHVCEDGRKPCIHPVRYRQLMEGVDKLATYEIQQGWHFCQSHYGMLVVAQSTHMCTCPTPEEIQQMIAEAEAEDKERYEMGIVAKLAPHVADTMRKSYYIKHDCGMISGVSYDQPGVE